MHLVNDVLRTKNMIELLQAMGINLEGTEMVCNNERVIFNPETVKDGEILGSALQKLLQKDTKKPPFKRVTLANLIAEDIAVATSSDNATAETHKKSCLAILGVLETIGLEETLDKEQEYFEIKFPSPVYAPLFSSLTYKYISIQDEKIIFNIKEYLKDHKEELILIDSKKPYLFAHSESFESKKIFYAEKKVSDDTVEVTPFFFVPSSLTPPVYHFNLDTSDSMGTTDSMEGTRLKTLKRSVIQFAKALFEFQPDAVINLSQFNDTTKNVGVYRKKDIDQLCDDVNKLRATGLTCLYDTTLKLLSYLAKSNQHNNVLLFTDGENTVGKSEEQIEALKLAISSLKKGSPLPLARNKVCVVSYDVNQPDIMHEVAELFHSSIVKTQTVDFTNALSKGELQTLAAVRELLTCRIGVVGNSNSNMQLEEYVLSCDMSGQFTPLEPKLCKNNESLSVTIIDGNGKTLLEDNKSLAEKPVETVLPGSAKVATQIGVFSYTDTKPKQTDVTYQYNI
ncbi:VWA domain-containing protein [Legionella hackeliae]|uniref:VWFA domain-containing protein n=1 Tax=Legionella hackeliae TaxID=449 RepID=A0A0A8URJ8_LEGHA|nr:vWA domain-containing protein [Legionella hackeliae]KTD15260.1 hypothetical protein Lhac_0102 [Legionella hackeliae]CEK11373.1 protein of unknown function [Legionella hackeliae]STX48145.1 Uncharacterised protein [Legionella hackeliae]